VYCSRSILDGRIAGDGFLCEFCTWILSCSLPGTIIGITVILCANLSRRLPHVALSVLSTGKTCNLIVTGVLAVPIECSKGRTPSSQDSVSLTLRHYDSSVVRFLRHTSVKFVEIANDQWYISCVAFVEISTNDPSPCLATDKGSNRF